MTKYRFYATVPIAPEDFSRSFPLTMFFWYLSTGLWPNALQRTAGKTNNAQGSPLTLRLSYATGHKALIYLRTSREEALTETAMVVISANLITTTTTTTTTVKFVFIQFKNFVQINLMKAQKEHLEKVTN